MPAVLSVLRAKGDPSRLSDLRPLFFGDLFLWRVVGVGRTGAPKISNIIFVVHARK